MLELITRYDTWLYLALGLIALFFLRILWLAFQNRTYYVFSVEREGAKLDMIVALIGFIFVVGLMGATYYFSRTTPEITESPTNTPHPTIAVAAVTPTSTPLPPSPSPSPPSPTSSPTLIPTPISSPTGTATPSPTVEVRAIPTSTPNFSGGQQATCPYPGVHLAEPVDGAHVDGLVEFRGTASVDNFNYYKFELHLPNGEWAYLQHHSDPVVDGVLGSWNSDVLLPREYQIRLVVVDFSGNYPEPCVIRLVVK